MKDTNFRFPTDYYYILLDGGTRRATFYNNSTIDNASQWYNWKPDRLPIYNKRDKPLDNKWSEYFVGPFVDILYAKFYARSRRIETLQKTISTKPVAEPFNHDQRRQLCEVIAAEGELKKLQIWMDMLIKVRPEYFL